MKSRKIKWYSPRLMRRAGRAQQVFDCGLLIMVVREGRLELAAWSQKFVTTRDGIAVPKDTAKLTAGLDQARMTSVAGIQRKDAQSVVDQLNREMARLHANQPVLKVNLGRGGINYA